MIQVSRGDSGLASACRPKVSACLQTCLSWAVRPGDGIGNFSTNRSKLKAEHIAEQLKYSVRQCRRYMGGGGEEKGSQQLMFGQRNSKAKVWTRWSLTELTSWGGNGFCSNNSNWAFQIWTRCQTGGVSLADISVRINRTVTALTAPVNLMNTQRLRARRDREPAEKPSEHWWTDGKVKGTQPKSLLTARPALFPAVAPTHLFPHHTKCQRLGT